MSQDKDYYHYSPSLTAAAIFAALFGSTTLFHLYQLVRTKTWYFTAFVIGGIFETIGFAARARNAQESPDWNFAIYVVETLGILLAPTLFAASIYMELGRIILLTDGDVYSVVKRRWMTAFFVTGDVFSFIVQAIGGAMLVQNDPNKASQGKKVILVGLFAQILFFSFFLLNTIVFWFRMHLMPTPASKGVPWQRHMITLFAAGAFILGRCIFRVIEYIEGKSGNLMSHEVYLYVLDAGFMLVVMNIFHIFHPSEAGALLHGGKAIFLFKVRDVPRRADVFYPLSSP